MLEEESTTVELNYPSTTATMQRDTLLIVLSDGNDFGIVRVPAQFAAAFIEQFNFVVAEALDES